jgi:hypothetical protein
MDSARLQPALLGGVFIGVMSALPFINLGNCCCCLWVLGGGALAVYLRQQNTPYALPASEGALLGLIAGFVGGIIGAVLSIPINMLMGPMQAEWIGRMMEANQDMPAEVRDMLNRMAAGTTAFAMAAAVMNVVVYSVFGLLGGLLGVAIFKKNAPPQPPTVIPHDPGVAH